MFKIVFFRLLNVGYAQIYKQANTSFDKHWTLKFNSSSTNVEHAHIVVLYWVSNVILVLRKCHILKVGITTAQLYYGAYPTHFSVFIVNIPRGCSTTVEQCQIMRFNNLIMLIYVDTSNHQEIGTDIRSENIFTALVSPAPQQLSSLNTLALSYDSR